MATPPTVTLIKDDTKPFGMKLLAEDGSDLMELLTVRRVTWTFTAGEQPALMLEILGARLHAQGKLITPDDMEAVADQLAAATREETPGDESEGGRFIRMSDTLARGLERVLRAWPAR